MVQLGLWERVRKRRTGFDGFWWVRDAAHDGSLARGFSMLAAFQFYYEETLAASPTLSDVQTPKVRSCADSPESTVQLLSILSATPPKNY